MGNFSKFRIIRTDCMIIVKEPLIDCPGVSPDLRGQAKLTNVSWRLLEPRRTWHLAALSGQPMTMSTLIPKCVWQTPDFSGPNVMF